MALVALAIVFDARPLLIAGAGLLLCPPLAALGTWLRMRGVSTERRLSANRIVEGERLIVRVVLRCGPLGAGSLELREPISQTQCAVRLPTGERRGRVELPARPSRIGRNPLGTVQLTLRDPLGLVRLTRTAAAAEEVLLVLPRTEPVRWPAGLNGRLLAAAPAPGDADPPGALEIDGIRPYRDGTPASRIHWASLARGAGLMERRLRADGDDLALVVLAPLDGAADPEAAAALRAAASVTLSLARGRGVRLLLPGELQPHTIRGDGPAWDHAHEMIALARDGHGAGEAAHVPSAPLTVWVSATRAAAACAHRARGRRLLVLPESLAGALEATPPLRVAGCLGVEIGERSERVST